ALATEVCGYPANKISQAKWLQLARIARIIDLSYKQLMKKTNARNIAQILFICGTSKTNVNATGLAKTEDDAKLLLKADKSELEDYVNLGAAQTITGQKQFNIIIVANVSKQGKNDASILLAGGGDRLVSSLVNQTELQEDRDIASGKSKAYVFDTQSDLNDWMAIQDNVAKLAIGDNLYIVDKQVVDYWRDGTDLKVLETEQPDITNVITTFGTATVQNYDNLSVALAGGGVKAIQDINASTQDDTLLLLKDDKTELIDAYNKTEVDALLNDKLNVRDQIDAYTNGDDDALLLLKADKTQLIDAYTKGETNNLSNNKADSGVSYTKGDDYALLLLKADKIQLIDAYTKGETNKLSNNKANSEVSYTKQEDDALLLLKADKIQLIDAYTKGETNNLSNNKADSGVSYTKGDDYALLLLKADKIQLIDAYTKGEVDNL
ncbi:MAG: hypothetical protein EZS28_033562, partial [Streblomastix strix]